MRRLRVGDLPKPLHGLIHTNGTEHSVRTEQPLILPALSLFLVIPFTKSTRESDIRGTPECADDRMGNDPSYKL